MNATRPTPAQLDHLRAAAAGDLFANNWGPDRLVRPVRHGGKVSRAVVERLTASGWLTIEPVAGCSAQGRYVPTAAALDFLATI